MEAGKRRVGGACGLGGVDIRPFGEAGARGRSPFPSPPGGVFLEFTDNPAPAPRTVP